MNRQEWRKSKARKRLNLGLTLGLSVVLFGFAIQVVIGSFHTVNTRTGKVGPGADTGSQQLMNDPNQEVTGGLANVGSVSGVNGQTNGNGGVSGTVVQGSKANPKSITKLGVTVIDFDGKKLVFEYFGIRITGHLTSEAQAKVKNIKPGQMAVIYAKEGQVFDGLQASDGKTADIGEIVHVELRAN
jgi:predicted signal transduction protein with EAL and GGDEF domain